MASVSLFSVVYAVLGLVPISPLIGVGGFLTFRELISPLVGMILGPILGGSSIVLGNILDFALGKIGRAHV